jgi:hypothetical protein
MGWGEKGGSGIYLCSWILPSDPEQKRAVGKGWGFGNTTWVLFFLVSLGVFGSEFSVTVAMLLKLL